MTPPTTPGAAGNAPATSGGNSRLQMGGHPRGLATLFFTEMWERFSYYGMRALLVLFMTASVSGGGMGMEVGSAGAIYGLYTSMVYLLSLPGGWVADKLWGQRKAVFVGGCIIASGHFSMAIPAVPTFYLGLMLIVLGTGLLKPNVSAMVGDLYPEGGARRDAGFSIFYMGINLGAFLGPLLCGLLGERYNFHLGFSLAGIGMVLGLVQYRLGGKYLGQAGIFKSDEPVTVLTARRKTFYMVLGTAAALAMAFGFLTYSGALAVPIQQVARGLGASILVLSGAFFLYLFTAGGLSGTEKKRLAVIIWLYLLAAVFWSGFEQAGSSLNLFARDLTDRTVAGWEMPASWLQNVNPILIIVFAPVFGWLWTWLAGRHVNPSAPLKFALGLLGLAAGFFVISWGAANATESSRVSMSWLTVTYFLHTVGELCLSPVGLSAMTKLAPRGRVGQMMGVWFIATALGNLVAGLAAARLEVLAPSALFWNVAWFATIAGGIALLASPVMKRLSAGAE
jgi:proton-dependent oligopeptide transporter, POT family